MIRFFIWINKENICRLNTKLLQMHYILSTDTPIHAYIACANQTSNIYKYTHLRRPHHSRTLIKQMEQRTHTHCLHTYTPTQTTRQSHTDKAYGAQYVHTLSFRSCTRAALFIACSMVIIIFDWPCMVSHNCVCRIYVRRVCPMCVERVLRTPLMSRLRWDVCYATSLFVLGVRCEQALLTYHWVLNKFNSW